MLNRQVNANMMDDHRKLSPERILSMSSKEAAVERFMAVSDDRLSSQIFHVDGDGFDIVVTSPSKDFKYSTLVKSPEVCLRISIRDVLDSAKKFNKSFDTQKINSRWVTMPGHVFDAQKKYIPAILTASPLQCVGHRNKDKSGFAEGALITKFYSEGSIFLKESIDDVNEQDIRGKLEISHGSSPILNLEKRKSKIYVAKSILAVHDTEDFKNSATNYFAYKHKEDHCKINSRKYENSKKNVILDINRSLSHDYRRNESFVVLRHALSLDQSLYSNIYKQDMNVINKNINHKIISRSCSFLREKKLSKLRCSQFNHLVNRILQ